MPPWFVSSKKIDVIVSALHSPHKYFISNEKQLMNYDNLHKKWHLKTKSIYMHARILDFFYLFTTNDQKTTTFFYLKIYSNLFCVKLFIILLYLTHFFLHLNHIKRATRCQKRNQVRGICRSVSFVSESEFWIKSKERNRVTLTTYWRSNYKLLVYNAKKCIFVRE